VAGAPAPPDAEHAHAALTLENINTRAIRTDLGIDLLCEAADTPALIQALLARGAVAVGEEALECRRIESGRPRYGVDLDDTVIPQEAGLNERAVSFTKGCYVGQETVARLFYRGKPNRHLRGLRAEHPLTPGDEVHHEDRVVATVTSATLSPRLGPIALALVRREAPPGSGVSVGAEAIAATVVELPFA
jgi:folate-binding protein YgfZ